MDTKSYLNMCIKLAQSVRIYNTTVAKQTLNYYQLHVPNWLGCGHIEDHPYVRHLRGLAAQSDAPAMIKSLDTGLMFDINGGYDIHPKTKQRLLENAKYFSEVADTIGAFGTQRLQGSILPYSGVAPLKNGTIIGYDSSLVEPDESMLIHDLQQWIYNTVHRWTNSGYIASDELYGAAFTGILYVHMPSAIVNIRDKYVNTQMAHSFHIDQYLCDYGLEAVLPILNSIQKYSLYKHLPWVIQYRGSNKVYDYLKHLITMDANVRISEYHTKVGVSEENVVMLEDNGVITREISTVEMSSELNVSESKTITALRHGEHVDNLPVIKVSVAGNTNRYGTTFKHMLYMWGYWATNNKYIDSLPFTLPTGEIRTLSAKTAFYYYLIHRPTSVYTDGFDNDVFYCPSMLDVSGYTGQDLVEFVQFDVLDRSLFTQKVEQIIADTALLRSRIDTIYGESARPYWEGEFPRHHNNMLIIIPDKQTWLTEQQLPTLTDEYLDTLFDTFTGYSTSVLYQRLDKAQLYKGMLTHLLSMSTHVVTSAQTRSECNFFQVTFPVFL
jgi:hypothetical protein